MSEGNGVVEKGHTAPKAVAESAESLGPRAASSESVHKDDATKITFTKNEHESAVHIGEVPEVSFAGMGKEELMKYANDPFWVKIRWALFVLFWLTWVGMLVAAIVIVVLAPKCPPPKPLSYWQKGVVYHTEVKSFQDGETNQDGVGDFKGLIGRLGHLEQLGVNMLVLPPIFKQDEDEPYGYGVVDFKDVNPTYGNLEDFKNFIKAAEAHKGMKVILDFIPNHSSKKHPWFSGSTSATSEYADYYVWKNCGDDGTNPPNTWTNVFNSSAWTFDPVRKQCFYHAYGPNQPDLNLANTKVQNELNEILRFWLDQGVAGFRLLSVPFLYESDTDATNVPENYNFVGSVRSILEEYEAKDGVERVLLVDTDNFASLDELGSYYGTNETVRLADLAINNNLIYNTVNPSAANLRQTITDYMKALPSWAWPTWVVSNRDRSRVATRLGNAKGLTDAFAMMQMLLPGTPVAYYGDDIGMEDVTGETDENCAIGTPLTETYTCNKARSPFQWDDTVNTAGFTSAIKPWHPVASADVLKKINAKTQTGDRESHFGIYQALVALRNQPAFMHGDFSFPEQDCVNNEKLLSFVRIRKGSPGYIVTINLTPTPQTANFDNVRGVPADAHVVVRSSMGANNSTAIGLPVNTTAIPLGGYEGLVLSFAPNI